MRTVLFLTLLVLPALARTSPATFTNKVWARADSTGMANGDRYTFLSDGTFIITSPFGGATFGRWNVEGGLHIYENGRAYAVDVASLTATEFHIHINRRDQILKIPLVPVTAGEPDTLQQYRGFNPAAFVVMAGGYEPSWGFEVEGSRARMETLGRATIDTVQYEGGWKQADYFTWTFVAKTSRTDEPVILTITDDAGQCSEEGDYSMKASLQRGGTVWRGCALLSRLVR